MAYGDFKNLPRRTASDKVFRDKAFNNAKNKKSDRYQRYQRDLALMVYKLFDKESALLTNKSASGGAVKCKIISNQQLAEELHKPLLENLKYEKYAHLLKTIFEVLILPICNK